MHVAAALNAKANVSMSRFEPNSYINYDKLRSNIDIVSKRSVGPVFYTQLYLLASAYLVCCCLSRFSVLYL